MKLARLRRYLPTWYVLPVALCYALAFPPYDLTYLIFPCFVLWMVCLERHTSWRRSILDGLWISQIITWLSFTWVAYSIHQFGNLPYPIAYALLVVFGIICEPQFWLFVPVAFAIRHVLPRHTVLRVVIFALAYASFDYLIPKLFVDTTGHAFYDRAWLRQAADLGGAPLLTFLTVLISGLTWRAFEDALPRSQGPGQPPQWRSFGEEIQKHWKAGLGIAVIFGFWIGYGYFRAEDIRNKTAKTSDSLQLAVIQANIGDFDKIAAETGIGGAADEILRRYFALSDHALTLSPRPQALIWPETAYPSTFRTAGTSGDIRRDTAMEEYVRSRNTPLLFGGYDHANGKDYNAFFMLDPPAGPQNLQVYQKNILLWFGEYMPLSESIRWLREQFPQVGNFGRGKGPSVQEVAGVPVSPIICYEALFASYTLPAVREGSRLILNVTNDSWFGPWGEPHLHFALTVFRGIEARVPQLRATNTGISALILPDGSVAERTDLFVAKAMNVKVPILTQPIGSLMLRLGDWFAPFAGVLALVLYGYARMRRRPR